MVIAPMMAASSTRRVSSQARHIDGTYAASSRSSGGRFQEFLAEIVAQQGKDEVGIKPTSRGTFGARWNGIDVQQALDVARQLR